MTGKPLFRYYLGHDQHPVEAGGGLWKTPLPAGRRPGHASMVTCGEYFEAVQRFLEYGSGDLLLRAITKRLNRRIYPEDVESVHIYLKKHGEFYHPSQIRVITADDKPVLLVVNAAVSETGKQTIGREYVNLERLNREIPHSFFPQVYGQGKVLSPNGVEFGMFLGEWLEGYKEFHLSENGMEVWDSANGNFCLNDDQIDELYTRIAFILTGCYHPETFEQIFPWHHASGDFVVNTNSYRTDVKLITVRQYAAMIEFDEINEEAVLESLLIFLINLSIRTRLDRLNGVGDIVWADDRAVDGTVRGFYDALAIKPALALRSDSLTAAFRNRLASGSETQLLETAEAIVSSYHPKAPDIPVIQRHLPAHIQYLYNALMA